MENNNASLPKGFMTVEEACELIRSDTRTDAKVDAKYLVAHINWIQVNNNFRIPIIRNATQEEIAKMRQAHPGRKIKSTVSMGSRYVAIETPLQREMLAETIKAHYRDLVGRDYVARNTRAITTVADEEGSGMNVRPRVNPKSIAKEGDVIDGGKTVTTNSDGMTF